MNHGISLRSVQPPQYVDWNLHLSVDWMLRHIVPCQTHTVSTICILILHARFTKCFIDLLDIGQMLSLLCLWNCAGWRLPCEGIVHLTGENDWVQCLRWHSSHHKIQISWAFIYCCFGQVSLDNSMPTYCHVPKGWGLHQSGMPAEFCLTLH